MRKRWLWLLALVACVWFVVGAYLVIVPIASWWLATDPSPAYTEILLTGANSVELRSLQFSSKDQQITLDDPALMQYLTGAFRTATNEGMAPSHEGVQVTVDIEFHTWDRERFTCRIPADADGITIELEPLEPGGDKLYYWVEFRAPVPEPIAEALQRLR